MAEERRETLTEKPAVASNGHSGHGVGFLKGLFAGAVVGTAAGILFAPRAQAALRALRRQVTDTAENIGDEAADAYRQAGAHVSGAVDGLHEKGREACGKVLSAVARGAQDVEDRAAGARTELHRRAPKATAHHSS